MKTVAVQDAEANLAELLDAVEHGEIVVIARDSRPIARIVPVHQSHEQAHELAEQELRRLDEEMPGYGGRFVGMSADELTKEALRERNGITQDEAEIDEDERQRRRNEAIDWFQAWREANRGRFSGVSIRELIDEGKR